MECTSATTTIEVERLIGSRVRQARLTAETAVPAAGREEIDVLIEQADISVESVQPREDAVAVDGEIRCQAVFRQGESYAAKAVAAQTRFSELIDIKGVNAESMARCHAVVEYVRAIYENGRMKFEMSVTMYVQAHALTPIDVITGISGVDGIQTRCEQITSVKLAAESRSETAVSEEVALPAQLDARVALMDWSGANVTGCEPDIGGVKVTGEICSQTLIGTGVPSRPLAMVKVVMPFEQLVEIPEWLSSDVTATAEAQRVEARIQPGEGEDTTVLRIEGTAAIDVRADHEDAATALCDAYAAKNGALEVKRESFDLAVGKETIDCSEQFRGTLMLSSDAPGVGTVLAARADPVISQWAAADGFTTVEGAIDIKAMYLPSGSERITSVRGELPFSIRCNGEWPKDAWVSVSAMGCEAAALMSDRLEIRLTIVLKGYYRTTKSVTLATDAELKEKPAEKGGVVVYWPKASDDAWSVAKRYSLPVQSVPETVAPGVAVVLEV